MCALDAWRSRELQIDPVERPIRSGDSYAVGPAGLFAPDMIFFTPSAGFLKTLSVRANSGRGAQEPPFTCRPKLHKNRFAECGCLESHAMQTAIST